jgi:hypothetical protein
VALLSRTLRIPLLLAVILACSLLGRLPVEAASPSSARVLIRYARGAVPIETSARRERANRRSSLLRAIGSDARFAPTTSGFVVAELTPVEIDALRSDPRVLSIEPDRPTRLLTDENSTASWGLDRVDEPTLPLDGRFHTRSDGTGADIYVIDTGVDATHPAFGGRVEAGVDFVGDGFAATSDPNGHGTHVAGTAAGDRYGIARGARIIPVRILDRNGSGFFSALEAALDWVVATAATRGRPAVVNLSLGGAGVVASTVAAIERATAAGVLTVTAAGNSALNACSFTPGGAAASAITVAATDSTDRRAYYSNAGPCVDLFAPGSGILSAAPGNKTAILSGTSMASPHVAGAAALLRAADPTATPAEISARLLTGATGGVVLDANGAPNRLLRVDLLACVGVPCVITPPRISLNGQVGTTFFTQPGSYELATTVTSAFYRCTSSGPVETLIRADCLPVGTPDARSYLVTADDYGRYLRLGESVSNSSGTATFLSASTNRIASLGRIQEPLTLTTTATLLSAPATTTVTPSGGSGSGSFMLTSSTLSVCTTSGFVISARSSGSCSLLLTKAEDAFYATATLPLTILVAATPSPSPAPTVAPSPVPSPSPSPSPVGVAPQLTRAPVLSGTVRTGRTLTVSRGSWRASGTISYTYAWYRCPTVHAAGASLGGCTLSTTATGTSYLLTTADLGASLVAVVTARIGTASTSVSTAGSTIVAR